MAAYVSRRRVFIEYYPENPDRFVVSATNLFLYEIINKKKERFKDSGYVVLYSEPVLSDDMEIKPIGNISDLNMKCFALAPKNSDQVAVGLVSGRVLLTSFSKPDQLVEFVPRHNRTCNVVAWNPVLTHLLACGLDKVRDDCSALVWDINKTGQSPSTSPTGSLTQSSIDNTLSIRKLDTTSLTHSSVVSGSGSGSGFGSGALFNIFGVSRATQVSVNLCELNIQEGTQSLAWIPSMPNCLAVGTTNRFLAIYDIREDFKRQPKYHLNTLSRIVSGVGVNPWDNEQLSTFCIEDGIVKIWDLRKTEDPAFSWVVPSLLQLSWCPTRRGVVATSSSNQSCIKLWSINPILDTIDSLAPAINLGVNLQENQFTIENSPREYHFGTEPISSFSWHPSDPFQLITTNSQGNVGIINVKEAAAITYAPNGNFAVAVTKDVLEGNPDVKMHHDSTVSEMGLQGKLDISYVIQERARAGYSSNAYKNHKEVVKLFNSPSLSHVWKWIYKIKYKFQTRSMTEWKGVVSIILNSKSHEKLHQSQNPFLIIYASQERYSCAKLCDWGFRNAEEFEKKLTKYENEGQYSKATALAVFHFNLKRALFILRKIPRTEGSGSGSGLNAQLIAMALSGYQDSTDLWKAECTSISNQLADPYIKAMFKFLALEPRNPTFSEIYGSDSKISLMDKIGFACRFLNYEELIQFLETTQDEVVKNGDLEGLVLTGIDISGKGIQLLQNYLNKTGDIQTVACLVAQVSKRKINLPQLEQWIYLYRNLLNQWQMWFERAKFDIDRVPNNEAPPQPHVFVTCKFCNYSFTLGRDRSKIPGKVPSADAKPQVTICPNCFNSLPRCVICLLPFSCTPFDPRNITTGVESNHWVSTQTSFENWFSWCQTCKHGGHVAHLQDWFKTHRGCPVADCDCQCDSLV